MAAFFHDMDEYFTTLNENIARLNVPITNENGESVVQLIGIDGNPTNDDTTFGNRQIILEHFKKVSDIYMESTDEPSMDDFKKAHEMALVAHSAKFNKLASSFDDVFADVDDEFKRIAELKTRQANGELTDKKSGHLLETDALEAVNNLYALAFTLKFYFEDANSESVLARISSFLLSFIDEGMEFFNNPTNFDEEYSSRLDEMYKRFCEMRRKIQYNARHALSEMIT